ncbi:hypothetical protein LCGC14_2871770, partial [marine sediment metagenome]
MPHNDEKPFTMAEFDAEMAAIRKAHRERPLPPPPGARPKLLPRQHSNVRSEAILE